MTKRKRPTRFRAPWDIRYQTFIFGIEFENEFFKLQADGKATVKEGYLSDGCSPTYKLPFSKFFQFGWVVGPPNGPRDPKTGLPISHKAFFLHDALLDFCRGLVDIELIHAEFCREINLTNWAHRSTACWFVCNLGPKR